MHGWNAQKSKWNIQFQLTQVLFDIYVGSVSKIVTTPRAYVLRATKSFLSSLYKTS